MRRLLLSLTLFISLFQSIPSATGADTTSFLRPCSETTGKECIESISVTLPNGLEVKGLLTGRTSSALLSTNDAYLSKISGLHDEWTFPGLISQNGGSKVEFYIFHWPASAVHCDNAGNCSARQEELALYARPTMLDGGRPPVRVEGDDAKIICPSGQSSCSIGSPPWNFDSEITFNITLKMESGFIPLYANGRTKNFSMSVIEMTNFALVNIRFSPLKLENVYFALADFFAIDRGLYVTDEPAMWIYTSENIRTEPLKPCILSGGLSIVTNAFNQWSPTWNPVNKSIDVQLRASHLKTDGSINSGYLEIRIPTAMAQCLWGINLKGEVDARISLTYSDGTPNEVITVTAREKDGFFTVISAGFHYSSPKVQIKLNQESAIPEISPSPAPTPTLTVARPVQQKKSITCQKGKFKMKIISVKPKCPSGYKRVA